MDYQYVNTDVNSTHYGQDYAKVDKDGKEFHIYRDGYGPEVPVGSPNVLAVDWHPAPVTGAGVPVAAAPAPAPAAPAPAPAPPPAPAAPAPPNPPGNINVIHTGSENPDGTLKAPDIVHTGSENPDGTLIAPTPPGNVNVIHTGSENPDGTLKAPDIVHTGSENPDGTPIVQPAVVVNPGGTDQGSTGSGPNAAANGGLGAGGAAVPDALYTVVHGDTLSGIAESKGIELSKLEELNPQIKDPSMIFPGQAVNLGGAGPSPSGGTSGFPTSSTYPPTDDIATAGDTPKNTSDPAGWGNTGSNDGTADPAAKAVIVEDGQHNTDPTHITDGHEK